MLHIIYVTYNTLCHLSPPWVDSLFETLTFSSVTKHPEPQVFQGYCESAGDHTPPRGMLRDSFKTTEIPEAKTGWSADFADDVLPFARCGSIRSSNRPLLTRVAGPRKSKNPRASGTSLHQ